MQKRPLRSRLWRIVRWVGLAFLLVLIATAADAWTAFGDHARGDRRARMEKSPQWQDGAFENPQPLFNDFWG